MTKKDFENQVIKQMNFLGCSREEAEAIVKDDEAVDKMSMKEIESDLTEEQKKAIKKSRSTGTRKKGPTVYKFDTKTKPKDEEKVEFLDKVFKFIQTFTENCVITNAGKEISFNLGANSYSLVLTKHRNTAK